MTTIITVWTFMIAAAFHHFSANASLMGDYYMEWKEYSKCSSELIGTDQIQTNFLLSKKFKKPEVIGNLTLMIPLDDSVSIDINFWTHSSSGGWKPNGFSLKFSRACQDMLVFMGNGWKEFLKSMNITPTCPIPKGVYVEPGYDVEKFHTSAVPQTFIYGNYKIVAKYVKNKRVVGCCNAIVYVKPTWEKNG